MSAPLFKPNHAGLQSAATSQEMRAALVGGAERLADRANDTLAKPGYVVESQASTGGKNPRARAVVIAASIEARLSENADHTLAVAAGAGGL